MELGVWDSQALGAQQTGNTNNSLTRRRPHVQLTEEDFTNRICFLEDFGVIVCKDHSTAVVNLNTHLRDHHKTPIALRKVIIEHFSQFPQTAPDAVELPEQPADVVEELGLPLEGFKCRTCGHITTNSNIIRTHCKKDHEQTWKGSKSDFFKHVKVQSFFRAGGLQKYFIVDISRLENGESLNQHLVAAQQLEEWTQLRSELGEELQVMGEAAKTDKTGWFKRTRWPEFFKGRNLEHLGHQARLPDKNEARLQLAAQLTEELVERSVKGLSTLEDEIRRWLRSASQTDIDVRPLARLQNPQSQATYASYIVRFVCFFLRIIADEEKRVEAFQSQSQRLADDSESESESESSSKEESEEAGYSDDSDNPPQQAPRRQRTPADKMKDAREIFSWADRQKGLAIRLWLALDSSNREAQIESLLDSLCSFIHTNHKGTPLSLGLVQFLAVLGIDTETNRLRTAKNYSYMLAGVVYCTRVLSIEKLLPSADRDEQTEEDRDKFLEARKKYLADGSFSPMSAMISLLAYGKHIAQNQGNSGNAYWSEDKRIFYLNGRPIAVERFCRMAQSMVADAEEALWPLYWAADATDCVKLDLTRVVDDMSFTNRGGSFVNNPVNNFSHGLQWMLLRARESEQGMQLQTADGTWKSRRVRQYLLQVDRFLELLLACVHVTSGQPARGSEITTIRFRNSLLQDRNIFFADGLLMTVVRYHKSQSQWDKPKIVPRFLPPRLAQVMAVYLVYVQPFYEYLVVKVLGGSLSDYVWGNGNGAWETDRLTRVLKRETEKRLGVRLHTLDYRHTAVGIGRVKVGEIFGRGYDDEMGEIDEAEVEDDGEDIIELGNARTTAMGVGNYSVPVDIVKHLSARSIEAFRKLSRAWHKFLGVDDSREQSSTTALPPRRKRPLQHSISELVVLPRQKEVRVDYSRADDVKAAMRQILQQENVEFRSIEQEQAIYSVLDRQSPLVVVLPTGGGKSMLFTVPALVERSGVTVVVVPYRALIEDTVERIQVSGIECVEWRHGDTNPASVVVVSADVAGDITSNGNFLGYATMLHVKGLLRRVVIDECHLVFTSSDWRPKLAKLKNLRLLPCPIVLLTATLPPVREGELESAMLIRNATYIRASTVRANTRYFVSWCRRGQIEDVALAMCKQRHKELQDRREKGVVYCKSKAQCERLANELVCPFYHSGAEDRAERIKEWLERGGLIVATSALGTGVDFPGIRYILHVGMPWTMIDFAQESGRGGRAGEQVDSVILVQDGEVEQTMEMKSEDLDVQAIGVFLIGTGCRRLLMSQYLDAKGASCGDIESARCDRCGEGAKEWLDEQQGDRAEWEVMQQEMDKLAQGCAICWVFSRCDDGVGEEGWIGHRTVSCNRDADVNVKVVDDFRRAIRDDKRHHSCRRCWVSQKYCATGQDVANRCQWPNIVVPIAYAAMATEKGQEIVKRVGFRGGDKGEYAVWLGMRHKERVWGEYFSNAMVVAIRVLLDFKGFSR